MAAFQRLFPFLVLSLLAAACSGSKKRATSGTNETAAQFCESFGKAACNDAVVSACSGGGTEVDKCVAKQQSFCLAALSRPEQYSSDNAAACLDAVTTAYEDGKLSADEIQVVREFAAPCDQLIRGPGALGISCFEPFDCNTLEGLTCVNKPGQPGTCQVPDVVQGGFTCTEPNQICAEGFYCDGQNCLARPGKVGDACDPDLKPCAADFNCAPDYTCQARGDLGAGCDTGIDCKSGVCAANLCVQEVILSISEPLCQYLR